MRTRDPRQKKGIVRQLDKGDPRSPDHPSNDDAWKTLARALGQAMADRDWDRINGPQEGPEDVDRKDRSHLRKILQ